MTSQFNFQPLNNPETGIHRYRLLVVILKSETETDKNRLPVSKWSLGIWTGSKIRENETVETLCDFGFFQCAQDGFILSFIFFNDNFGPSFPILFFAILCRIFQLHDISNYTHPLFFIQDKIKNLLSSLFDSDSWAQRLVFLTKAEKGNR